MVPGRFVENPSRRRTTCGARLTRAVRTSEQKVTLGYDRRVSIVLEHNFNGYLLTRSLLTTALYFVIRVGVLRRVAFVVFNSLVKRL